MYGVSLVQENERESVLSMDMLHDSVFTRDQCSWIVKKVYNAPRGRQLAGLVSVFSQFHYVFESRRWNALQVSSENLLRHHDFCGELIRLNLHLPPTVPATGCRHVCGRTLESTCGRLVPVVQEVAELMSNTEPTA